MLGCTLFNIFMSDFADGIESSLIKFVDDTVSSVVDTSEGKAILQRDRETLEEWA